MDKHNMFTRDIKIIPHLQTLTQTKQSCIVSEIIISAITFGGEQANITATLRTYTAIETIKGTLYLDRWNTIAETNETNNYQTYKVNVIN